MLLTTTRPAGHATSAVRAPSVGHAHGPANVPADVVLRPAGASAGAVAQAGFFDNLLSTAVPGLLGAASSALSGDSKGALSQVRATGASAAPMLAQQGAGALGGLIGGTAGQAVSSLGAPLGQGLGSVISGQSSPGEAAGGLLGAAQPMLLQLLMSMLSK